MTTVNQVTAVRGREKVKFTFKSVQPASDVPIKTHTVIKRSAKTDWTRKGY